jgi:hypothetical protein
MNVLAFQKFMSVTSPWAEAATVDSLPTNCTSISHARAGFSWYYAILYR